MLRERVRAVLSCLGSALRVPSGTPALAALLGLLLAAALATPARASYLPVGSGGNIGIGTTTASEKLEVIGTVKATRFIGDGSGLTGITGTTQWDDGAASAIYYTLGNVGIGTSAPDASLHVLGSEIRLAHTLAASSPTLSLFQTTTRRSYIQHVDTGNVLEIRSEYGPVSFWTGTNNDEDERVRIDSSGNVGIGSSVPQARLDVEGSVYVGNGNVGLGSSSPANLLDLAGSGGIHIASGAPTNTSYALYNNGGTLTWNGTALATGASVSGTPGYISRFTSASALGDSVIYSDGTNVGIGSAAPVQKLDVAGNVYATGNIGIGSASPRAKLDVNGEIYAADAVTSHVYFYGDTAGMPDYLMASAGGVWGAVQNDAAGVWSLAHKAALNSALGTPVLSWTSGGLVGISSTAPQAKLDVNGTIYTSANIGIGTSVPQGTLDIASGQVVVPAGTLGAPAITFSNDLDTGIYSAAADTISMSVNGLSRFILSATRMSTPGRIHLADDASTRIQSLEPDNMQFITSDVIRLTVLPDGNVGIGSTVPQAVLDVEGSVYFGDAGISSNNVGVGTTAPVQKVEVIGTVKATAFIGDGSGITNISGSISGLGTGYIPKASSATTIADSDIYQNASNIGIGTVTPARKLDVYGDVAIDQANDNAVSLHFAANRGVNNRWSIGYAGVSGANAFRFINDNSGEVFRINYTGNVGVGSTAPQAKLDVEGGAYFGNGNVGIGTSAPVQKLEVAGNIQAKGTAGVGTVSLGYSGANISGGSTYFTRIMASTNGVLINSGETTEILASGQFPEAGYPAYEFRVRTANAAGTLTNRIEVLGGKIDIANLYLDNVNVGINSSAPQAKLDVEGGAYFGSGNVGIGTADPDVQLAIYHNNGTDGAILRIQNGSASGGADSLVRLFSGSGGQPYVHYNIYGGSNWSAGIVNTSNTYVVSNSGNLASNRFFALTMGGNAGIGSTAPQAKLDVEGSAYFGNGNIGVGSAAPSQAIDVIGTVKATAFIGDGSGLTGLPASGGWTRTGTNIYPTVITDNVGIGSSVPQTKLDVQGEAYFSGNIGIGTTNLGHPLVIRPSVSDTGILITEIDSHNAAVRLLGEAGAGVLTVLANNATAFHIDGNSPSYFTSSVYFGFMDTSPDAKLEISMDNYAFKPFMVSSDDDADGDVFAIISNGNVGVGSSVPQAKLDVEGDVYVGNGNVGIGTSAPVSILETYMTSSGGPKFSSTWTAQLILAADVNADSPDESRLIFQEGWINRYAIGYDGALNAFVIDNTGALGTVPRLLIDSSGNVAIGTITPQARLDVEGSAYFGNGNVGLGSSSPANLLDLAGSGGIHIAAGAPTNTSYALYNNGGTLTWNGTALATGASVSGTPGYISKFTSASSLGDSAIYENGGNVGIGSSAPTRKLEIYNDFVNVITPTGNEVSGYMLESSPNYGLFKPLNSNNILLLNSPATISMAILGSEKVQINSNGNVGINSSAPQAKLDVEGSVYFGDAGISSNNVGVGTTAPVQKVEVIGTVKATAFIGDGSGLTNISGSITGLGTGYIPKASSATTINDSAIYQTAGGNIGIGTTVATSLLHVAGATPVITIQATSGAGRALYFVDNGNNVNGELSMNNVANSMTLANLYNGPLRFITNNAEYMRIDLNGNIGISSSAPQARLDVEGTAYVNGNIGIGSTAPGARLVVAGTFGAGNNWQEWYGTNGTLYSYVDNQGGVHVNNGGAYLGGTGENTNYFYTDQRGGRTNMGSGGDDVTLTLFSRSDAAPTRSVLNIYDSGTVATSSNIFTVVRNGNVGISSSAPQAKLDVEGGAYFGNGNVGIGTSVAGYLLEVNGDVKVGYYMTVGNSGGEGSYRFGSGASSVGGRGNHDASDYLRFVTGYMERMRVTYEGNVGISSDAPQAKLDVEGSVYFGDAGVSTNNVGVGTSAPVQKVEVIGTVKATAFIGDGSGLTGITGTTQWSNGAASAIYYNAGNVGIGTSVPAAALYVKNAGGYDLINLDRAGSSMFHISEWGDAYVTGGLALGGTVFAADGTAASNAYRFASSDGTGMFSPAAHALGLSTNAFERVRITSSGNVGINSTVPQAKLDVAGNIYVGDGGSAGSGNVGVGSAVPTQKVDVIGTVKATAFIGDGSGLTNVSGSISGLGTGYIPKASSATTINDSAVYQSAGGNIGIGTTAPSALFQVGSASGTDERNFQISSVGVPTARYDNNAVANNVLIIANKGITIPTHGSRILYQLGRSTTSLYGSGYVGVEAEGDYTTDTTREASLVFGTSLDEALYERMRIMSSGNVGVGSSVPQAKLDVEGGAYFGSGNVGIGSTLPQSALDVIGTVTASAFTSTGAGGDSAFSGNVGIGTSLPQSALAVGAAGQFQVSSAGAVTSGTWSGTSIANTRGGTGQDSSAWSGMVKTASGTWSAVTGIGGMVARWTDASTIGTGVLYDNAANVGIGSSAPQTRLDVTGTVTATAFIGDGSGLTGLPASGGWSRTGTNVYTTTSTDNVGIGSSVPRARLEVAGGAYFTTGNVGIGTTDPGELFHVNGNVLVESGDLTVSNSPNAQLSLYNPGNGNPFSLLFPWGGNGFIGAPESVQIAIDNDNNDSSGTFSVARDNQTGSGTVLFLITQAGNVGINSTAPQAKLDVEGGAYFGNGNVGIGIPAPLARLHVEGDVYANNGYVKSLDLGNQRAAIGGFEGLLYLWDSGNNLNARITSSGSSYMNGGNVGINSSAPQAKLDVEGSVYFGDAGVSTNNVGVGTSAPVQKVEVIGTVKATAFIGDGSGLTGIGGTISGLTPGYHTKSLTATTIGNSVVYDNGTNVGIGTSVPLSRLDLVGAGTTSATAALIVRDSAGAVKLKVQDNGNVGIGTSGATYFLDVVSSSFAAGRFMGSNNTLLSIMANGNNSAGLFFQGYANNYWMFRANNTLQSGFSLNNSNNINFSGAVMFWESSTGNVGIASTAPQAKLDVEGDVYVGNGNIGVGTSVPAYALEVIGTGRFSNTLRAPALAVTGEQVGSGGTFRGAAGIASFLSGTSMTANANLAYISNYLHASFLRGAALNTPLITTLAIETPDITGAGGTVSDTAALYIQGASSTTVTGQNYALWVDSGQSAFGGNVGINTLVPQAKLDVEGSVYVGNGNVGLGSSSPANLLDLAGSGGIHIASGAPTNTSYALYNNGGTLTWNGTALATGASVSGTPGYISRFTSASALGDSVIYSDGTNVGISSAAPLAKLELVGAGTTSATQALQVRASDGTARVTVLDNGNVGIGVTEPAQLLDIYGSVRLAGGIVFYDSLWPVITNESAGASGLTVAGGENDGSVLSLQSTVWHGGPTTGDYITFGVNNGEIEAMRIVNPGNVGIGSTAPQAKLDVEGSVYFGDAGVSTNNIGVGSSVPSQKVDVIGTVKATAFIGDGSGLTGLPASGGWTRTGTNVYTTTSSDNVGIGSTLPRSRLDVAGTVTASAFSSTGAAGDSWFTGNLGIGTSAPQNSLVVGATGQFQVDPAGAVTSGAWNGTAIANTYGGTGQNSSGWSGMVKTSSGTWSAVTGTSGMVTRWTDANTIGTGVLFDDGTNAGVGSSVPRTKLDVTGTVTATAFVGDGSGLTGVSAGGWSRTGTNVYLTTSGDNVGIGSSAPQARLDVQGNAYVNGNIGIGTTAASYNLSFRGDAARSIGMENNGSNNGSGLTLSAGNATGGTNRTGGNLTIQSGQSTGNQYSNIYFYTPAAGGSGAAVRAPSESARLNNWGLALKQNANLMFNAYWAATGSSPVYLATETAFGITHDAAADKLTIYGAPSGTAGTNVSVNYNAITIDTASNVGIGLRNAGSVFPAAQLDVYLEDDTGNTVRELFRMQRADSDSAGATGIGASQTFYLESDSEGVMAEAARLEAVLTDAANASKDSALSFYTLGPNAAAGDNTATVKMTLDSAGNLGIASTAPQAKLDVEGSVYFGDAGVSTNNVGVGTSAPVQKVEVIGTVKATAFIGDGSGLTGLPSASQWTTNGTAIYYNTGNVGIGTSAPDNYKLKVNGDVFVKDYLYMGEINGSNIRWAESGTQIQGGADYLMVSVDNVMTQYMNASGNVGINSSVPQAKLDVEGSVYVGNGNVGIGSSAPTAKLAVVGNALFTNGGSGDPAVLTIAGNENVDTGPYAMLDFKNNDGGVVYAGAEIQSYNDGSVNDGDLRFRTADNQVLSTVMTLTSSGNVGIGSTVPAVKLDVVGGVYVNGNVGIGTTAPAEILHVVGNVKVTGTVLQGGGDLAEMLPVHPQFLAPAQLPRPGDVVMLMPEGGVRRADEPATTAVAGIVSSAPAHVLKYDMAHGVPIALAGVVPCRVTDENGLVQAGDLLVSSSEAGYAMKAPSDVRPGAVIGKALKPQSKRTDLIDVLIMMR